MQFCGRARSHRLSHRFPHCPCTAPCAQMLSVGHQAVPASVVGSEQWCCFDGNPLFGPTYYRLVRFTEQFWFMHTRFLLGESCLPHMLLMQSIVETSWLAPVHSPLGSLESQAWWGCSAIGTRQNLSQSKTPELNIAQIQGYRDLSTRCFDLLICSCGAKGTGSDMAKFPFFFFLKLCIQVLVT